MALVPVAAGVLTAAPAITEVTAADIGFLIGERLRNQALGYVGKKVKEYGADLAIRASGQLRKKIGNILSNSVKFANRTSDYKGSSTSTALTTPTRPPTEAVQRVTPAKRSRAITGPPGPKGRFVANLGPFKTFKWRRSSRSTRGFGRRRGS